MIGSTISHYKILEKLGEGGMGEVFLAEDTELERKVALKFLPSHVAGDEEALARFQREAKATAALQHPNIVTIHEIGTHEGRRFIAMAYIEGDLLSRRIAAKDLTVNQAIDIAILLCDALGEAHGAGIIHRDLKPDNIVIDKRGHPHVLDFGLAVQQETTRLTQEGSTVGTLHYMSPEQAQGEEVDQRTDIFSLGAILYEMIAGQKAFPGEYRAAIHHMIVNENPQPLARYNNQASPELERVVTTALAKDREVRYQTMSGVAAALKPLRSGSGISVASTSGHPLAAGPRRRKGLMWAAAAAIVLVAAVLASRWLSGSNSSENTPAFSAGQIKTIAVLPLENASDDPEEEYFADGMTEALISDLARISALRVVPRSLVMPFKDSTRPRPEIAAELGADALIEGSVWHGNDRVRINVELVRAASAERLWGESYEGELGDVLTLQSQVARAITNQVKVNLAPLEEQWFDQARSVAPEAHKAYLKGRYYLNLVSIEGIEKAREEFERAIAIDPDFAPAYLGLAEVAFIIEPWEKARNYAEKALELDPTLAEAHGILADVKIHNQWDWAGARKELEFASSLKPNLPDIRVGEGKLLLLEGKLEEGLAKYRSALALNPLSHPISCSMVGKFVDARKFAKAVDYGTHTAENFPDCPFELYHAGRALIHLGRYDEAIRYLEMSLATEELSSTRALIGCAYALSGRRAEAEEVLASLQERDVDAYSLARLHAALGNRKEALEALEKAFEKRSSSLIWVHMDPMFDELHAEPRFRSVVERMGLPAS